MQFSKALGVLLILIALAYISKAQASPYFGPSPSFDIREQTLTLSGTSSSPLSYNFLTINTPSNIGHKSPFYTLHSAEKFLFDSASNSVFMLSKITAIAANSFTVQIEFKSSGPDFFSLASNSLYKFWYMVIDPAFTLPYISTHLTIISTSTIMTNAGLSYPYSVSSLAGSALISLAITDTQYFYSLVSFDVVNQNAAPYSASIKMVFETIDSGNFRIKINYVAPEEFRNLKICLFIYNKSVYSTTVFKLMSGVGAGSLQPHVPDYGLFMSWISYPQALAIYGLSGFQMVSNDKFGFDFTIMMPAGSQISVRINNKIITSFVHVLQFTLMSIGALSCPSGSPYINSARTSCTSSCTSGYPSTTPVPFTSLLQCVPCQWPCQTCTSATSCLSCVSSLTLVGTTCKCPAGKYPNTASQNCGQCFSAITNCVNCDSATQCTLCDPGLFVNNGMCTTCTIPQCVTCSTATVCQTCQSGLVVDSSTGQCVCPSGKYKDASGNCQPCSPPLTNCLTCSSSTVCLTCSSGYSVGSASTCVQCPTGCSDCASPTICNTCFSGLTLTPTKQCICNPGYYISASNACLACMLGCDSCNVASICIACRSDLIKSNDQCFCPTNSNYLDTNANCVTCSNGVSNCQTCSSSSVCTQCMTCFYMASSSSCLPCFAGCMDCNAPTTCITCRSDLISSNNQCFCPSNQNFLDSQGNCVPCGNGVQNCVTCTTSTQCTQCSTGFYLNAVGTSCPQCGPNCITCDLTGCLTCQPGSIQFTDPTATPPIIWKLCSQIHDPQCNSCTLTNCLGCVDGFFLRQYTGLCQNLNTVFCGDGDWIDEVEKCDDGNLIDGDGCSSQCQVQADYQCLLADKLPSGASLCKFTKDLSLQIIQTSKQITSNIAHIIISLQPSTFTQWIDQLVQKLLFPLSIVDQATGTATILPYNSITMKFKRNNNINQLELVIDYDQAVLENSFLKFNLQTDQTSLTSLSGLSPKNGLFLRLNSYGSGVYFYNYDEQMYAFQSIIGIISTAVGLLAFFMMILGCLIPVGKLIILQALAVIQISFFTLLQFKKIPPTFYGLRNLGFSNGYNDLTLFQPANQIDEQTIFTIMGIKYTAFSNDNVSLIMFIILPAVIGFVGSKISFFLRKTSDHPTETIEKEIIENKNNQTEKKSIQKAQITERASLNQKIEENPNQNPSKMNQNNQNSHHQNTNQKPKQQYTQQQQSQQSLPKIIFQRILYEMTFYGIVVTGLLAWVSIVHSFQKIQAINLVFLSLICLITIIYTYLFIKTPEKPINLSEIVQGKIPDKNTFNLKQQEEKQVILTTFGQFNSAYKFMIPYSENYDSRFLKKFYLFFLVQRLISSIIIVLIPSILSFTSVVFIIIYILFIVSLIIIYKNWSKFQVQKNNNQQDLSHEIEQKKKEETQKDLIKSTKDQSHTNVDATMIKNQLQQKQSKTKETQKENLTLFSYLHQNYILRQIINFTVIIIIQLLYLVISIFINSSDTYKVFTSNSFVTKIIPLIVLSLLSVSLIFNLFLWVWELKKDQFFMKTWLLLAYFFPDKFLTERKKQKKDSSVKSNASQQQQEQVVKMLNQFIYNSVMYQRCKQESLSLEVQGKSKQVAKESLLGLFKAEETKEIPITPDAKCLRNSLIDEFWEEI